MTETPLFRAFGGEADSIFQVASGLPPTQMPSGTSRGGRRMKVLSTTGTTGECRGASTLTADLGLPVGGLSFAGDHLVGTVVPLTDPGTTTVTPVETIYHRRVRLHALGDKLGNVC